MTVYQPKYRYNAIAAITGVITCLVGAELLLRTLPVKTDPEFAPNNAQTPVIQATAEFLVEPLDWKFTHAEYRRINNYGFVADRDYHRNSQPISVIGDSYIASSMLPYTDTIAGKLEAKLGDSVPIYAKGLPMYPLSGYLGAAEFATKEFNSQGFVFLLTEGDIRDSLKPQYGAYYIEPSTKKLAFEPAKISRTKRLMNESALYRYLYKQIKFDPGRTLNAYLQPKKSDRVTTNLQLYRDTSIELLANFSQKTAVKPHNTIFVIDSDRTAIYAGKSQARIPELSAFKEVAEQHGYIVIDTHDLFQEYYQTTGKKLDFSPTDLHWNEVSHRLVAEKIYPILNRLTLNRNP
jgi:hypothetical protein